MAFLWSLWHFKDAKPLIAVQEIRPFAVLDSFPVSLKWNYRIFQECDCEVENGQRKTREIIPVINVKKEHIGYIFTGTRVENREQKWCKDVMPVSLSLISISFFEGRKFRQPIIFLQSKLFAKKIDWPSYLVSTSAINILPLSKVVSKGTDPARVQRVHLHPLRFGNRCNAPVLWRTESLQISTYLYILDLKGHNFVVVTFSRFVLYL